MDNETSLNRIVAALLDRYGTTFAEDIGIDLRNEPSPLFCLLMATLLSSTRISSTIAMDAACRMIAHGWTTPQRMLASSWRDRIRALGEAKYVRYDESRATMLGEMAQKVMADYGGDLRNLREKAGRDPGRERQLIDEFSGIGQVGVGIFCREVQAVWEELYPTADEKALGPARKLGLPGMPDELSKLVPRERFPHLTAALVKVGLNENYEEVLEEEAGEARKSVPA